MLRRFDFNRRKLDTTMGDLSSIIRRRERIPGFLSHLTLLYTLLNDKSLIKSSIKPCSDFCVSFAELDMLRKILYDIIGST